ncbi:RNA polymerase factor sigma-54 [Stappia sp. ES.058]|uniref:RNA polymerase factor sigma-54 n=1 Tax=Stappia sp. ES.058 TaxID=1881061 RepID=UPI00087A3ED0|nr:RNA polymerase factor sigma-54 [Stappia sp. ES.058]SDU45919.1 RNA polymerase, sigma 54 subunit, RpoN/SigL [Stappia sp. ES.058]
MALSPKLEIRQGQSLIMTPQLMQAIKLLQMSSLDLTSYVEAEMERNPLLERVEGEGQAADPAEPAAPDASSAEGAGEADGEWIRSELSDSAQEIAGRLDTDLGNVYPDDPGTRAGQENGGAAGETLQRDPFQGGLGASRGSGSGGGDDYNLEAFVASEMTLQQHLADQMVLVVTDAVDRLVARTLIDNLDEAGYLRLDLAETAQHMGIERDRLDAVLSALQTLEPSGVFARSLAECLKLQLIDRNRYDPAMARLIENIELLARHDYAGLRAACAVDDEDLAEMIAEIRALDPKPGSAFGATLIQPVVPDVLVRPARDGSWAVELNSDTLPRVLVNQTYYATVSRQARGEGEKSFLSECLQTANWLAKSLDQRARTILKVSSEIVRQQDAFLTRGVEHLRPLNLRTIADAISMHESTVSRVTSNKYMATPRGIFELKYFFSASIPASGGGDAHSAEAVRHRIRALIDAEAPDAVLSDDTIVKVLQGDGVDIARRTVAKYRESLRIPSSVQRRREKRARAP